MKKYLLISFLFLLAVTPAFAKNTPQAATQTTKVVVLKIQFRIKPL
jgi:hypothetical protein